MKFSNYLVSMHMQARAVTNQGKRSATVSEFIFLHSETQVIAGVGQTMDINKTLCIARQSPSSFQRARFYHIPSFSLEYSFVI